ncbi:MAG: hypothetical protein QOD99_2945 [Chthoniobacter sp.]|jgi:pyruvate/2-oxoglutarate dehydrogenase complex dihydrolipoamide dehydrogenase (E3) component|nr:hypothetical protein [Chthoniobacter sp.]
MNYDFVVIGGGSAGYAAAATAGKLGLKVAIIEGGQSVGGLCILRGCMPSKTLIESANRFLTLRRSSEFGLKADAIAFDAVEIQNRKRRLVGEFADYRRRQLEMGGFDFVRGWATFRDAHTVEVAGDEHRTISAKTFLIATGSKLTHIDIPGCDETCFLDSDAVLDSEHIPKSVIVLGAGATGLEFAHFYSGLGSDVTVLQRGSQVLKEMDGDVAGALTEAFRRRGIRMFLGTMIRRIEKTPTGKRVHFGHEGEERSVEAEEIIYALGRSPQLDGLGLENAGIDAQHGHVTTGATQQTNVDHVFAAGDAAGPYEIVHLAIQQGELAARNAARLVRKKLEPLETIDYRLRLFVIFTEPQVASVGFTEKELLPTGAEYRTAQYPFSDHGKSMVIGETDGFVKLIAGQADGEILGAAVVGPHASELIHEIAVAMHFHATVQDLAAVPHYHPTLSEIWTYPAEELALSGEPNMPL